MSCFYQLEGSVRLRGCEEVEAIVSDIRGCCGSGIEVDYYEAGDGSGEMDLILSGGQQFASGCVLTIDELLESLGPFAVEPAVIEYVYDDEDGQIVIAADEQSGVVALSRHTLRRVILPALGRLTPADNAELIGVLSGEPPLEEDEEVDCG